MAKQREPADVRRYREAQEAKKRNRQREDAALQYLRDAVAKAEQDEAEKKKPEEAPASTNPLQSSAATESEGSHNAMPQRRLRRRP
jgi:hypothetical protein